MKIYGQISEHDCGIAVTQSLIRHFHGVRVNREELYSKSCITREGMSLLDLERLNREYGIGLESYEMSIGELRGHDTNNYFILLIKREGLLHYVIAKKGKDYVTLFGPGKGSLRLSYEALGEIYANVFITITPLGSVDVLPRGIREGGIIRDPEGLLRQFLIQFMVMAMSLIVSWLMRGIFGGQGGIGRLLIIALVSHILIGLGEYLRGVLSLRHHMRYSKALFGELMDALLKKSNSFYQKISGKEFLLLTTHINNISQHHSEYFCKGVVGLVTLLGVGALLVHISPWFIPILLLSWLINLGHFILVGKANRENIPMINGRINGNRVWNHTLSRFLDEEINRDKLRSIIGGFKGEYLRGLLIEGKYKHRLLLLNQAYLYLSSLFQMGTYIVIALILDGSRAGAGNYLLINFLYDQVVKSFGYLLEYKSSREQYAHSLGIYRSLLRTDNVASDGEWIPPNNIVINNLSYYRGGRPIFQNLSLTLESGTYIGGPSGSGKSTLYGLISGKLPISGGISPEIPPGSVIYQTSSSHVPKISLREILNKLGPDEGKGVLKLWGEMGLPGDGNLDVDKLSSGQRQFINIVGLLGYSNRVMLLDEIASNIHAEIKFKIFNIIFPIIIGRNFVLCSEHAPGISGCFRHKICFTP